MNRRRVREMAVEFVRNEGMVVEAQLWVQRPYRRRGGAHK